MVKVYTDGSFKEGYVGYGFLIQGTGVSETLVAKVSRPGTTLQNVEAELKAVLEALKYIRDNRIYEKARVIVICYDMDGVKKLLTNDSSQSRNGYIKTYAEMFERLSKEINCKISFEKIRGHEHPVHNRVDIAVRRKLNLHIANEKTKVLA
ncbi:RNase H family protein [Fervidobacterium sp.]